MAGLPPHLRDLDDALAALPADSDAMLLRELDGFLAGVVVCPDLIPPSEWLPIVLSGDDEALFETPATLERLVALIMRHYNAIVRDLQRGRFAPIYDVDERDDVLWEFWMTGFSRAMALRPDSWDAIVESSDHERAAGSMMALMSLSIIASNDDALQEFRDELGADEVEALSNGAPDVIPEAVTLLHRWRLHTRGVTAVPPAGREAGRNDPCPCGSGHKYKRCCGST